jgi:hypothetical protein
MFNQMLLVIDNLYVFVKNYRPPFSIASFLNLDDHKVARYAALAD